jgi:hypothetical protein
MSVIIHQTRIYLGPRIRRSGDTGRESEMRIFDPVRWSAADISRVSTKGTEGTYRRNQSYNFDATLRRVVDLHMLRIRLGVSIPNSISSITSCPHSLIFTVSKPLLFYRHGNHFRRSHLPLPPYPRRHPTHATSWSHLRLEELVICVGLLGTFFIANRTSRAFLDIWSSEDLNLRPGRCVAFPFQLTRYYLQSNLRRSRSPFTVFVRFVCRHFWAYVWDDEYSEAKAAGV